MEFDDLPSAEEAQVVREHVEKMYVSKNVAEYKALIRSLEKFKTPSGTAASNIIEQKRASYHIKTPTDIKNFFDGLERCRRAKVVTNFCEKQFEPSGIMLDFDLFQPGPDSQLAESVYTDTITLVIATLREFVDLSVVTGDVYAMIIKRPAPRFIERDSRYKDGFHLIIPGIKIERRAKKYLIRRIIETSALDGVFEGCEFAHTASEGIDKNSAGVPVCFAGNCKPGSTPHDIHAIYRFRVGRASAVFVTVPLGDFEKSNITHEFSLNYERAGGMVQKFAVEIMPGIELKIPALKQFAPTGAEMVETCDFPDGHTDYDEIQALMNIISTARCEEQGDWWRIVTALANRGERYRAMALEFSGRRAAGVRTDFDAVWARSAGPLKKYAGLNADTVIYNFARADNLAKFEQIIAGSATHMLSVFAADKKVRGALEHYQIAKILHLMMRRRYVSVFLPSSHDRQWYEFVTDESNTLGEVYKWRHCRDASSLSVYLSEKVPAIFDRVIRILTTEGSKGEDAPGTRDKKDAPGTRDRWYKSIIANVELTSAKLYNHGFKTGVIAEAAQLFDAPEFAERLDKEPDTMGVGNGILLLEPRRRPALITGFHKCAVSRHTRIRYEPFDIKNAVAHEVFRSIVDLFPAAEMDAMMYILTLFATSLNARAKVCLMLTLYGGGANGKSYLMELMRRLLGSAASTGYGYGAKLPVQYLTEKDAATNSASSALMPLQYARFAYFSETEKGEVLRASKVKKLVGSTEPIPLRELYGRQQDIEVNCNFVLTTNFPLAIESIDHGTRRRMLQYTMKIKLCDHPDPENAFEMKKNTDFADNKVKDPEFLCAFLSILTLFLGILDMKYAGKLGDVPNATINRETEDYINSQDTISRFIAERVAVMPRGTGRDMVPTDMTELYTKWYDANIRVKPTHDLTDIAQTLEISLAEFKAMKGDGKRWVYRDLLVLGPADDRAPNETCVRDRRAHTTGVKTTDTFVSMEDIGPRDADYSSRVLRRVYDEYERLFAADAAADAAV